jgi:putative solute:sodium symporter small subunit
MLPPASSSDERSGVYWQRTRRLTLFLLALWVVATFCVIFFARDLYRVTLFGWPLSFYMAAQGILLIYVAIIAVYAWRMRVLDKRCNNDQQQGRQHGG